MNDSELSILNKSVAQLTHFITAAYQTYNSHLLGADLVMLADAPAPAGTPDTTNLNDILNSVVQAPGTTSIATVPTTPDTSMYQMLSQVQTLDSYISLLTAFSVYNEHPTPYDITKPDQASAFTQAVAKWRSYVITGGTVRAMAGYLPIGQITAQSYNKSVTNTELHVGLLDTLFGGFSLPDSAKKELDSILTNVVAKLGNFQVSIDTQGQTLDHFITYYYFSTVEGTGGTTGIPAMYVPKVRTFYLHIDQNSWKSSVSVGKSSVSATHFDFNMNYLDMNTTMNPALVATDMTAINGTIQKLTGKTAAEVNTSMNMQAIHADPQSA
jgi:hypothetical protein